MKLFPFYPAKAQTVTNPDGFPVYFDHGGSAAEEVCIFKCGRISIKWPEFDDLREYSSSHFLRLGPKPGKTVYLNCWVDSEGLQLWDEFTTEAGAKLVAQSNPQLEYAYIAIPVTGPEIEP